MLALYQLACGAFGVPGTMREVPRRVTLGKKGLKQVHKLPKVAVDHMDPVCSLLKLPLWKMARAAAELEEFLSDENNE